MKFEMNGCDIFDDDGELVGRIFKEDCNDPFLVMIDGHFTQKELEEVLAKLKEANKE